MQNSLNNRRKKIHYFCQLFARKNCNIQWVKRKMLLNSPIYRRFKKNVKFVSRSSKKITENLLVSHLKEVWLFLPISHQKEGKILQSVKRKFFKNRQSVAYKISLKFVSGSLENIVKFINQLWKENTILANQLWEKKCEILVFVRRKNSESCPLIEGEI